jgi:predicted nucleic acid-binding protein
VRSAGARPTRAPSYLRTCHPINACLWVADALGLADRHRLTVHDSLYLQLAADVGGELATLDRDLVRAASAEGVLVVALSD